MTTLNYEQQCTKYFAPLDEIAEAFVNGESLNGISHNELCFMIQKNEELDSDLCEHCTIYTM